MVSLPVPMPAMLDWPIIYLEYKALLPTKSNSIMIFHT